MRADKQIKTRAGVIWAIIGVVVSALLVLIAFSIDELSGEARAVALIALGVALLSLLINLKGKKNIDVKDRLDDL